MNLYDVLAGDEDRGPVRIAGVVVAVVTNTKDPKNMGRVKVKFPWLSDNDESNWARVAAPMAGKGRGAYFPPEVHDEVLVAFEQGDVRFPYLLGGLWNGKDAPPAPNEDGNNDIRVIRSRTGHLIRLTDKNGEEKIEIIDSTGKNSIVFDATAKTVTVASDKDITLSAPNGAIKLDAKTVEIKSSGDMNLKGATINLN